MRISDAFKDIPENVLGIKHLVTIPKWLKLIVFIQMFLSKVFWKELLNYIKLRFFHKKDFNKVQRDILTIWDIKLKAYFKWSYIQSKLRYSNYIDKEKIHNAIINNCADKNLLKVNSKWQLIKLYYK